MDIEKFIDLFSAEERFMSNENLYKKFLFEFPNRTLYQDLKEQLAQNKVEESFDTAHRMKGIIENLSLNRLSEKVRAVVETLRVGEIPDEDLQEELDDAFQEAMDGIRYIKENNIRIFEK